jgi:hypothetical protein
MVAPSPALLAARQFSLVALVATEQRLVQPDPPPVLLRLSAPPLVPLRRQVHLSSPVWLQACLLHFAAKHHLLVVLQRQLLVLAQAPLALLTQWPRLR